MVDNVTQLSVLLLIQDRGGIQKCVDTFYHVAVDCIVFSKWYHAIETPVNGDVVFALRRCERRQIVTSSHDIKLLMYLTLLPFSQCGRSATCTVLQRVKTHTNAGLFRHLN